ncbi:MAG: 16S rRNA (uracil(1498)-N(3))-methyltransferase [Bacteroidia bacterium]|nr:16S rRNA (uracil(1498)-N(3))-methyltransferase [Bacteroidia bacterium]MDW8088856.1 RsmE family RNA methyltransferase [Bacteroidia bacterium]
MYLRGTAYHQAIRVQRHRVGERLWITNGKGLIGQALVTAIRPAEAECEVEEVLERPGEPPAPIALVAAVLKQPMRMEWLVEKAVELGATALYFLPMARSLRRGVNKARLVRVAIAALTQNLRSWLPQIEVSENWESVPWESYSQRLMGEIGATSTLRTMLAPTPQPTLWVVGPEGDFTADELAYLRQKKVQGVSLGRLRLRAETAALAFLSHLKTIWEY